VEKIILLYFGFKKNESNKLIRRTQVTKDIKKLLGRTDDPSFPVVLNNALKRLVLDKKLLFRRYSRLGINNKGIECAVDILEDVKTRTEVTDWKDIIPNL